MLIKSVVYLHDTKKPTSKTESITDTKKKTDRKIIKKNNPVRRRQTQCGGQT